VASHLYAALTGRARRGARAILFPGAAVAVLLSAAPGHAAEGQAAPMRVAAAAGAPAEPAARPLELGSYLAGHHAFRQRDFGAAARYMSEAVAAQPAAERLLLRALVAKLASGETDSARTLARRLLALEPDAPLSGLSLAVSDFKAGRFEAARTRLASTGGRGPNAFTVPLLTAWAEAALGRYDAARAALPEPGDNPGFAPFRSLHGALILDLAGRPQEAEGLYLEAVEQARRPTVRMVQAVGSFYRRAGDEDEAERRYTDFVSGENRSPLIESALGDLRAGKPATPIVANGTEGAAEALLAGANLGLRARSIEMALIYGRLALDLRPDFPSARVLVGQILESVGRDEEAVEVYASVNEASPLSWSARLSRAAGLARLGRDEEAIGLLRRMAAERPERTDALTRLGDILRNRKRFAEAVEAYDAAIERIGTVEQRHWRLLFSRGIALERSKTWPRAEKDLLAALELAPDEPYLLNYLGYSWVDQGIRIKDARKMIERAVELEPQSGAIVDSLGWALYRIGDYDGAVEQLERAAELEPLDPTVNDHLGDAYWRVGRRNEATFQWRRTLNLDPEPDQVPIVEGKIARGLPDS